MEQEAFVVCIDSVHHSQTESSIRKTIYELNLGTFGRIDIVYKGKFNRVFVHFLRWNDEETRENLIKGEEMTVVYDASGPHHSPRFWKMYAYTEEVRKERKMRYAKFCEDIRLQDKGRVVVLATESISNIMCRYAATDVTEDVFRYEWKCAISEVFKQQGQISAAISYNKEEKDHVILCARKNAMDKITKFRDELSNKM
jgi:hypothetical protein